MIFIPNWLELYNNKNRPQPVFIIPNDACVFPKTVVVLRVTEEVRTFLINKDAAKTIM